MPPSPSSERPAIRVEPVIAYRGEVMDWAADWTATNPFYTFWFLEAGSVRIDWQGGTRRVAAGRAVLIPPGLRRRHRFRAGTRLVSLSFRALWDGGGPLLEIAGPVCPREAPGRSLAIAARRAIGPNRAHPEADRSPRAVADQLALHGATELFVAEVLEWAEEAGIGAERAPSVDPRLARVLADLEAGVRAGPLPFARWREQTGLGRVQLERIARRELGVSLRARRDELLLAAIRTGLAQGGESLKETAARFGFFDAAHFTRWVRVHAGCPPRELRGRFL